MHFTSKLHQKCVHSEYDIHLFYMIYTTCYKGKKETCAKEELCSLIKQNDLILSQLEGLFRQLKK